MKPNDNGDLSRVRSKVRKVKLSKKARAEARLRMRQAREAAALAAAQAARAAALRCWEAEEERLASLPARPKPKRRVRFALNIDTEPEKAEPKVSPRSRRRRGEAVASKAHDEPSSPKANIPDAECTPQEKEHKTGPGSSKGHAQSEGPNPKKGNLVSILKKPKLQPEHPTPQTETASPKASKVEPKVSPNLKKRKSQADSPKAQIENVSLEANQRVPKASPSKKKRKAEPGTSKALTEQAGSEVNGVAELDALFDQLKSNKKRRRDSEASSNTGSPRANGSGTSPNGNPVSDGGDAELGSGKKARQKGGDAEVGTASPRPARYTKEGFRIYTEEEIAADQPKGLNGPCPFDCSCCF